MTSLFNVLREREGEIDIDIDKTYVEQIRDLVNKKEIDVQQKELVFPTKSMKSLQC